MTLLAELTTLNGLPAHPLIVHLPVMLVPLALIGAVIGLIRAPWRSWALPVTAVFSGVALIGVQLAISSGEGLEELSGEKEALIERHSQLAEQARPIVLIFFAFALAAAIAQYLANRSGGDAGDSAASQTPAAARAGKLLVPLCVLSVLAGTLSTVWVYRTGHTGAESVWQDEGKGEGEGREAGEGGEEREGKVTPTDQDQQAPVGDDDGD